MASNDPSFGSVVALLHMDDTGLSDLKNHTVTKGGNAARSSTQAKFGTYSAAFDGSSDYLSLGASADFSFGTSPFTVEAWLYIAGNSAQSLGGVRYASILSQLVSATGGFGFGITGDASTTGTGLFWEDKTGAATSGVWTTTVSQGSWHHVCCCRSGGTMYLGLDGTIWSSAISGGASRGIGSSSNATWIAGQNSANYNYWLNGYLDDVRITKGVARYTADYTVPSAVFPNYGRYVAGAITESTPHTEFRVRSYRLDTGALLNEIIATGSAYEVPCCAPVAPYTDHSGPVMVSCYPRMSGIWAANTAKAVGDYTIPTDPAATPHVFKCTSSGTTHSTTEPTWDTTPNNTTSDGSVTWTCIGRMVQPILQGPLIPSI